MPLFTVRHRSSETRARRATLQLARATIETPAFMPVGTQGTVKAMSFEELEGLGYRLILGNTFHLYLRPGSERIARFGGLPRFIGWNGAMLTDSGGYQVFSLKKLRTIREEGVRFRSPIDGSLHDFTPERVMEIQHELGADILMAFDECPPYPSTWQYARESMERTHRWAERCSRRHEALGGNGGGHLLFGIVQGSVYEDLRLESAQAICAMDFPGIAIGGVSVGEPAEEIRRIVSHVTPALPEEKPRYLMGVGLPEDILEAVTAGIDLFDCVLPTRLGRNGTLLTSRGRIHIKNARFRDEDAPVDPQCACAVCRRHSAAYLRHLHQCNEILGARLATYHNLAFYAGLLEEIRQAIESDTLGALRERCRAQWGSGSPKNRDSSP